MKIKISKSLLESLDKNEVGNLYIGTDGNWIDPKRFAIHFNNHVQARVKVNPETDKVVSTHGVDTQINSGELSQEMYSYVDTNPSEEDSFILETPDNQLKRGSKENRVNTILFPRTFLDENGNKLDDKELSKRYLQAAINLSKEPAISYFTEDNQIDPNAESYPVVGITRSKNHNPEGTRVSIKLTKMDIPGIGQKVVSVLYNKTDVNQIITYYISNWDTYSEWIEHDSISAVYEPFVESYNKTKLRKQIKESLQNRLNKNN